MTSSQEVPATGSPLLSVSSITKRFAGLKAVGGDDGLSFVVDRATFVGLIGPNGAGKSTTFNLLSGVLSSETGSVVFDGYDITDATSDVIAEHGVGRTFQTPRAFDSLSVIDNVVVGVTSPGERLRSAFGRAWRTSERSTAEEAAHVLERVGLVDRANDPVVDLSGGELRMLEVARQLVRKPTMLLLDEPTAGVHPRLQERLALLLAELHSEGMTFVVVEHNLHFLLSLADHVLVLTHGELLTEGSPAEVRTDPAVIAAYLGDDHAA